MPKNYLNKNVLEAAQERISWTFDRFDKIFISFSGGKDSTVMTHLVMAEAMKRGRKVGLFFVDWECQFQITIEHIQSIFDLYKDFIEPYWIALPMTTWNGCSQYEPEWTAWDENKKDLWIREKPEIAVKDEMFLPFYYKGMTFEEFTPLFAKWYSENKDCANFIGIRSQESLNRYRAIAKDGEFLLDGKVFTTRIVDTCWAIYPIYDWNVDDIWTYYGKTELPYNQLYDRMYKAGLTVNQMRIDEPFGDTQRKGLWLYQIIEPKTWSKMVLRVAGANTGSLYSKEIGNVLGNNKVTLPTGQNWEGFANLLLDTMPPTTREHYKNKITVYIHWFMARGYPDGIPDEGDYRLEAMGKIPSWRRIVKTLLRNDYWCKGLGFSPTKSSAYDKYLNLMRKRRKEWKIFEEME